MRNKNYFKAKAKLKSLLEIEHYLEKELELKRREIQMLQRKVNRISKDLSD